MNAAGFNLKFDTKWFFDGAAVEKLLDRKRKRAFSIIGRNIRQRARRSIKRVAPTKGMMDRASSDNYRTRKSAIQTIRRRQSKVSSPGQPPISHARNDRLSIRQILYAFDPRTMSVVVGPVRLNQFASVRGGRVTVPQLLEAGGTQFVTEKQVTVTDYELGRGQGGRFETVKKGTRSAWHIVDRRRSRRAGEIYRTRTATFSARPFMGPAKESEQPKFAGIFAKAA